MKKLLILPIVVVLIQSLQAQSQLGLQTGNYSGNVALEYNPAFFHAGPLKWDFSIISGGAFVETDYVYVKDASVANLLFSDKAVLEIPVDDGQGISSQNIYYQFVDAVRAMNNSASVFLMGPSFSTRIGRRFSIGVFAKQRVAFSANQIDNDLSFPSLNNWLLGAEKEFLPVRTTGLMWGEVALNFATGQRIGSKRVSFGGNVKFLMGQQALYVFSPSTKAITVNGRTTIADDNELYLGFTDFEQGFDLDQKGSGLGLDLGLVIVEPSDENRLYKWRFGVSLSDLGFINFKQKGEAHHFYVADNQFIQNASFDQVSDLASMASALSQELMNDPNASYLGNRFTIFTPTAIHANFDYALKSNFYVNGSLTRRVILNPMQVQKENQLSVSVRYETNFFELGIPAILYDDRNLRFGLWFRFGPLTIGSDHISTLFVPQKQLSGSDVYFALRITDLNFRANAKKQSRNTPDQCYW